MKLYSQEQVKDCLNHFVSDDAAEAIINTQTPIQLPSDMEIYEASDNNSAGVFGKPLFEEGAEWMRQQILNQNK